MKKRKISVIILFLLGMIGFSGCENTTISNDVLSNAENSIVEVANDFSNTNVVTVLEKDISFDLENIPEFSNQPYVVINNNIPFFEETDDTLDSFENYSELDNLERCGTAFACVGKDIMPTEERGVIGQIKPTGWHTIKYDCVDGKYLYNRCHLIGFQLAGENANEKNLITGTRYMNTEGMLPFEDMVADYVKKTNYHVLYRVTPVFEGENLLAKGVLMEAKSIEDNGEGVQFNVFCYNSQPQIQINYVTGESFYIGENSVITEESKHIDESQVNLSNAKNEIYILNTNTKKFHAINCQDIDKINSANREETSKSRTELIEEGYTACKKCHP